MKPQGTITSKNKAKTRSLPRRPKSNGQKEGNQGRDIC